MLTFAEFRAYLTELKAETYKSYRKEVLTRNMKIRPSMKADQASWDADKRTKQKRLKGHRLAGELLAKKVNEDAPTMSIGPSAAGLAGLDRNPPVSQLAQRKWVGKNGIVRRKKKPQS